MAWEWAPPTWDAAATLATGLMAVLAALIVGRRQIKIAERQTEIQAGQSDVQAQMAEIERTKLRMEMFARRHEVYAAAFDFLGHFLATNNAPRLVEHDGEKVPPEEFEVARRFRDACHIAPFIFRPEVDAFLSEIRSQGRHLNRYKRKVTKLSGSPSPQLTAAIRAEQKAADALEDCDRRLTEIFGPEMRLGERQSERNVDSSSGS